MSLLQLSLDQFDGVSPSLLRGFAKPVEFVGCVDAFALEVFLQDGDVAAELVHACVLRGCQALADFIDVDRGLCGFGWWTRSEIDKLEVVDGDAESLDVCSGKVQVDVFAIGAGSRDDIDRIGAPDRNPIASPRHGWWLGGGSLLPGLSHLLVSLARGSKALDLLDAVVSGKCDLVAGAEDGDQIIGDRGGEKAAERFGELAIVGLVPADRVVARGGNEFDMFHVALVRAFAEKMRADRDAVGIGHAEILALGRAA